MKWSRRVRTLIRPLLPGAVVRRARLVQYRHRSRINLDLRVPEGQRSSWLRRTPDTYRVGPTSHHGPTVQSQSLVPPIAVDFRPDGHDVTVVASDGTPPELVQAAVSLLSDPAIDAGAVGLTTPTRRWVQGDIAVAPHALAVRSDAWTEVGGPPSGDAPLVGFWERLTASGRRLAVQSTGVAKPGEVARLDEVVGQSVVILALVPMHDVGGGSRGAQLALEALRRGCHVTYVSLYGSTESSDLGQRFVHPRLEQRTLTSTRPGDLLSRLGGSDRLVVLEAPAPEFTSVVADLAAGGFTITYDLIDDWTDAALGGEWFDERVEKRFIDMADAHVAVSPDLVARLERLGVDAIVVPNGVNASLFSGDPGPPPVDLDVPGPVIGYHGSLYGDWLDWEGVREVSALGSVVMIGDARSVPPDLGPNVHFLGPKPHQSLPRYLSRFDVGLVPFELNDTTHAVSPLKVFEYLAAGVPVAAPPLRSLAGLEGVYSAERLIDAVQTALDAPRPDPSKVLKDHSWSVRLEAIYSAAGHTLGPQGDGGAQVLTRPVVHYVRDQRSL